MGEVITIGLDIAKSVFQAHGVDEAGAVVIRKRVSRAKLLEFFASLPPCLVGIVALGDLADDRVPETEKTLRSISHPAEPDVQNASATATRHGHPMARTLAARRAFSRRTYEADSHWVYPAR